MSKEKEPETKRIRIMTKRLVLEPMTEEETRAAIDSEKDEELRDAYNEMLSLAQSDEANWEWYAPWKMTLKKEGTIVGDICFKGPQKIHAVEIGYGVKKEFEKRGYTTEAAKALTEWAFTQKEIYFVEAETSPGNSASRRVLEKLGFREDGTGKEGPRFVLEKKLRNSP